MNIQEYFSFYNQQTLAEKHGVSQAMISKWARGVRVSGEVVLKFCSDSDWQVTPHELRPDLYPNSKDGLPPHMREVA